MTAAKYADAPGAILDALAFNRAALKSERPAAVKTKAGRAAWNQRLFDNFRVIVERYGVDLLDWYAERYGLEFIAEPPPCFRPRLPEVHRSRW